MGRKSKYLFAVLFGVAVGCGYGALCFKLYKKKDLDVALDEIQTCRGTHTNPKESVTISLYECTGSPMSQMIRNWREDARHSLERQLFQNKANTGIPFI